EKGPDLGAHAAVEERADPGPGAVGRGRPLEDLVALEGEDGMDALPAQIGGVVELAGVGGRLGSVDAAPDADPFAADQGDVLPEVADLAAVDDERSVLLGFVARAGEGAVDAGRTVDPALDRRHGQVGGPALGGVLPEGAESQSEKGQQGGMAPPYT